MSDTPLYDKLVETGGGRRCSAHGKTLSQHIDAGYDDCERPSDACLCGTFPAYGLHWDTCPGRGRFHRDKGR